MNVLTDYEKTAVRLLVSGVLSPQQVEAMIQEGEFIACNYTGCGYFLTLKQSAAPDGESRVRHAKLERQC